MNICQPLRARIVHYFLLKAHRNPEKWINGGEIEKLAMNYQFKASNGSRRCRELAEKGVLERKLNLKRQVMYRYHLLEQDEAWEDDPYDL